MSGAGIEATAQMAREMQIEEWYGSIGKVSP